MTFDLDLWPTDLKINRDHLLTKDYLPTKFEASGAKRSWVISCTRWSKLAWPLTLTFDLKINRDHLLTKDYLPTKFEAWITYSPRTMYLPRLKLLGQSVIELSVAQGEVNWHDLWPWPLTWKSIGIIYSPRTIYLPSLKLGLSTHQGLCTYQDWSFWGKVLLSYQLHKVK